MITRKNFNEDLEKLYSSQNEEEVINNLFRIIKFYNVDLFKDIIRENPYFKMIAPELVNKVISDLNKLRNSISKEIKNIDDESLLLKEDLDIKEQLKKLKTDCLLLIDEVDEKKSELLNLL